MKKMKKKIAFAAVVLYIISMTCACAGQDDVRTGSAFITEEIAGQRKTETECDAQEKEADTEESAEWMVEPLSETMYVRVDGCKIKKGPGEEYETAGTMGLLAELYVTGRTTDAKGEEWYQIAAPKTLEYGCLTEGDYYIKAEQVKT